MTSSQYHSDPHLTYDDLNDEAPGRDGSVSLWAGIGLLGAGVTGVLAVGVWMLAGPSATSVANKAAPPEPSVVLRTHPNPPPADVATRTLSRSVQLADTGWMFAPGINIGTRHFTGQAPAQSERLAAAAPLPPVNPVTVRPVPDALASIPLPERNPLLRSRANAPEEQVASLPPPGADEGQAPRSPTEVALPTPGSGYAVYDIAGKTVYMPSGERLEAHSGLGDMFDDPRHVSTRMRGPTPPNVYDLKPREALFHGVEALRLTPQDRSKMYGRDGILAHTYLLGPRGDSNGCVSFKDYEKFLAAYKRGEITRLVVVAQLTNAPPRNPLLAFFTGR